MKKSTLRIHGVYENNLTIWFIPFSNGIKIGFSKIIIPFGYYWLSIKTFNRNVRFLIIQQITNIFSFHYSFMKLQKIVP